MNFGPCRVSVRCCFTTGLGAGRDLEHGAEPAVWPQSQERKEGRTGSQSLGGCQGAGVSPAGGWQPGWRQLWGSPSPSSGPAPHSTHNSVPVGRSCQHVTNGQSGAGEALGPNKATSALGGWSSVGLGAAGYRAGGLSVIPQAASAPQAMHSPDLPDPPACGFCFGF